MTGAPNFSRIKGVTGMRHAEIVRGPRTSVERSSQRGPPARSARFPPLPALGTTPAAKHAFPVTTELGHRQGLGLVSGSQHRRLTRLRLDRLSKVQGLMRAGRSGKERAPFVAQTLLAWIVLLFCVSFTHPALNINCVFGPGTQRQTFMPEWLYFAILMIYVPLAFYLPIHLLLRRW